MPIRAGDLRARIAFDQRAVSTDVYGGQQGDFVEDFVVAAKITPRFGGEEVMAARLAGRQPVTIMIRYSSDAVSVTEAWRARDARSGALYNIRSIVVDPLKMWVEFLCEKGVQT